MKKAKGPAVQAGVAGFVRNWLVAGETMGSDPIVRDSTP